MRYTHVPHKQSHVIFDNSSCEIQSSLLARLTVGCAAKLPKNASFCVFFRCRVDDGQLNTIGEGTDWLSDSRIFGNYNVAYVSSGSSERSNPAGGRFRGRLGRAFFRRGFFFQVPISLLKDQKQPLICCFAGMVGFSVTRVSI